MMMKPTNTPTFLPEAACAASPILAHARVAGERRTDDVSALVERSAT